MELEQPATPDSEAVVVTAPSEASTEEKVFDDNGQEIVSDPTPPEDEETEEEIDGVKLRGRKEALERMKAERLMHKDYTQKTQTTADEKRAVAQEREQFQRNVQAQQQFLDEVADLRSVDRQLAQFQNANWQQLTDQDPVQALKLHTTFTQLQAQRGQLVNALTQKQQAQQQEQQRSTAKQLMDARQVIERDIKGWSPELAGKLMDFGVKEGFPLEAMQNITQPAIVKMLHKAYLFDQLEKQRKTKPPAAPAPPASRLNGASAVVTKEPSAMSDKEFATWRKRQIAQRS